MLSQYKPMRLKKFFLNYSSSKEPKDSDWTFAPVLRKTQTSFSSLFGMPTEKESFRPNRPIADIEADIAYAEGRLPIVVNAITQLEAWCLIEQNVDRMLQVRDELRWYAKEEQNIQNAQEALKIELAEANKNKIA